MESKAPRMYDEIKVTNSIKSEYTIKIVRIQGFWQTLYDCVLTTYCYKNRGKIMIFTDSTLSDIYLSYEEFLKFHDRDEQQSRKFLKIIRDLYGIDIGFADNSDLKKIHNEFMENVHVLQYPGELNKCLEMAEDIWHSMIVKGYDRSATLLAFGGGVVGDLGGYISSNFLRGIKLIHMPTSIISKCSM